MQQLGLKSPVRLKKYRSYRGNMGLAAENILQRQFKAEAPCEKWVTDITEFRAGGQKLYLSPILDLFNGEIVAWETACRPAEELVKRMLNKGLESLAEGEGNDSNLLIVFYVQIMPDDFVMQLHRF